MLWENGIPRRVFRFFADAMRGEDRCAFTGFGEIQISVGSLGVEKAGEFLHQIAEESAVHLFLPDQRSKVLTGHRDDFIR